MLQPLMPVCATLCAWVEGDSCIARCLGMLLCVWERVNVYMCVCVCSGVYISMCIAKHITGMWVSCCICQSLIISDYVVVSGRITHRLHVCVATLCLSVTNYPQTAASMQTTYTSHSTTCLHQLPTYSLTYMYTCRHLTCCATDEAQLVTTYSSTVVQWEYSVMYVTMW